jgi:hypothetical protein
MHWLERMFVLPKARNSFSDILGTEEARVVSGTIHRLVATTVLTVLSNALVMGDKSAETLAMLVTSAIHGVLDNVSPALSDSISSKVREAITGAEALAEASLPSITSAVVAEIGRILHISD